MQVEIDAEAATFGDIIQGDYEHNYQNLTLRQMFMYNWLVGHCDLVGSPMPSWILKADDDFYINVPLALRIAAANPQGGIM